MLELRLGVERRRGSEGGEGTWTQGNDSLSSVVSSTVGLCYCPFSVVGDRNSYGLSRLGQVSTQFRIVN